MNALARTVRAVGEFAAAARTAEEFLDRTGAMILSGFETDEISISFCDRVSGEVFQYASPPVAARSPVLVVARDIAVHGFQCGRADFRISSIAPAQQATTIEAIDAIVQQIAFFAERQTERSRQRLWHDQRSVNWSSAIAWLRSNAWPLSGVAREVAVNQR